MSDQGAKKRPAFQFYPGDWLRSTDLRSCSIGARGLWIDMICLMHEGNPYGHLKVNQKVILTDNLSRMVGESLSDVAAWVEELKSAGVVSVNGDGCMYSRRMVKDENIRNNRAIGGKKGGNPALLAIRDANESGDERLTGRLTSKVNLEITPASASASALASAKKDQRMTVANAPDPVAKSKRPKREEQTLNHWLAALPEDQEPMPADDPLLVELDTAGVPVGFVELAWAVFVRDWGEKTAKDWPATFRNAIRKGWIRLWYFDGQTGDCRLNSTGELARRSFANG